MLGFFVLTFSYTRGKYIQLDFVGRNGEKKRIGSIFWGSHYWEWLDFICPRICSWPVQIFGPRLKLVGKPTSKSGSFFSWARSSQGCHRICDAGRIKRESKQKCTIYNPHAGPFPFSLLQAQSGKVKGDKQTLCSSLEPRIPLHSQNCILSLGGQLLLSPRQILTHCSACVWHRCTREVVQPTCAAGYTLENDMYLHPHWKCLICGGKKCIQSVIALSFLGREWLAKVLVCRSLAVKTAWPYSIQAHRITFPRNRSPVSSGQNCITILLFPPGFVSALCVFLNWMCSLPYLFFLASRTHLYEIKFTS